MTTQNSNITLSSTGFLYLWFATFPLFLVESSFYPFMIEPPTWCSHFPHQNHLYLLIFSFLDFYFLLSLNHAKPMHILREPQIMTNAMHCSDPRSVKLLACLVRLCVWLCEIFVYVEGQKIEEIWKIINVNVSWSVYCMTR